MAEKLINRLGCISGSNYGPAYCDILCGHARKAHLEFCIFQEYHSSRLLLF